MTHLDEKKLEKMSLKIIELRIREELLVDRHGINRPIRTRDMGQRNGGGPLGRRNRDDHGLPSIPRLD